LGVHVLADDWVQLGGLRIHGLDSREDPRNYPATADADVVLVHSPHAFQAARQGIYLAGHTHGLTSVNTAKPSCLIRRMRYMFNRKTLKNRVCRFLLTGLSLQA
jgi:hypothetical protein